MPFKIVRNDITKMNTEAIVNTANAQTAVGPGCDRAVYEAAGYEELLAYRKAHIGYVKEGDVFITPGFSLPAKYIIHAVSPLYVDGGHGEEELLRSCYRKSLALAAEKGIRSIAFPLISTGGFGYPKEEGMRIAVDEIHAFLLTSDMQVCLVVFDEKASMMGKNLYPDLEAYIDRNYVQAKREEEYGYTGRPGSIQARWEADGRPGRPAWQHTGEIPPLPVNSAGSQSGRKAERPVYSREDRRPEKQPAPPPLAGKPKKPGFLSSIFHRPRASEADDYEPEYEEGYAEEAFLPDEQKEASYAPDTAAYEPAAASYAPDTASYAPATTLDEDEAILEMERRLAERMEHMSDTFPQYLLYLIRERGMQNAEVYKRAIVDKKVFSKIKNNPDYHPQKLTALCLCIGAKLTLDESKDLLARAGYALSPCDKTDIIFSYFIENRIYDMIELDIQLEEHGLPCIIS